MSSSAGTTPAFHRTPNRRWRGFVAVTQCLTVLAFSLGSLHAQAQATHRLESIESSVLPGDKVELKLKLSDTAPQPLTFTVDNPARISLDLPDTGIAMPSRRVDVKKGVLDTVNVAEANGRTRVVLNLDRMVTYDTRAEGDFIYVTLAGNGV